MSGTWSCTFRSASSPFLAVATTRNSPVPSTTSVRSRRKKGLSSTTRTVGRSERVDTMRHGGDLDLTIEHPEPHGPAVVPAHRDAHQRDAGLVKHLAGGHHVALAHLN